MRHWLNNKLHYFQGSEIATVLARGASSSLIIKVSGTLISFGTQVLLARLLGEEDYGCYVYILAWVQILLIFSVFGFDSVALKFTAQYLALEQWDLLRGLISKCFLLIFASSCSVMLVTFGIVCVMSDNWPAQKTVAAFLGFCLIPVVSMTMMRQGALLGLQKVIKALLPDLILKPIALASFAIILVFVYDAEFNASVAMGCNLVSALLALALGAYWLKTSLPPQVSQLGSKSELNEWLKLSFPMMFISGMYIVLDKTDMVMLGILLDTTSVAIYSVASMFALTVGFGLMSANSIVAPLISKYYSQNKIESLQQTVTLAARAVAVFTVVVDVVLILFGKHFLALFGAEFVAGYNIMLILLVGVTVWTLVGPVGFLMVFTGHQKEAAVIVAVSACINILANYILIPLYGVEGAAIATSFSIVILNLWMFIYVTLKLKIKTTAF